MKSKFSIPYQTGAKPPQDSNPQSSKPVKRVTPTSPDVQTPPKQ
ncbi:MAG: hypothetical protein SFY66_20635 [Oculatellaceae cyanobacterium bins.114]|nr:hypothetical protein [Oculatellaceae cyanobacterium bins.114]